MSPAPLDLIYARDEREAGCTKFLFVVKNCTKSEQNLVNIYDGGAGGMDLYKLDRRTRRFRSQNLVEFHHSLKLTSKSDRFFWKAKIDVEGRNLVEFIIDQKSR